MKSTRDPRRGAKEQLAEELESCRRRMRELERSLTELKEAPRTLGESEERLHLIAENMTDIIILIDQNGAYRYVSPSFKDVMGYAPAPKGRLGFEFVHPDDMPAVQQAFMKSIATQSPEKVEYRYRHASGKYIWVEAVGKPLVDPMGNLSGAVLSLRDITDRKKAEEAHILAEEKYRNLVENIEEVIYRTDEKGIVTYISPSVNGLRGYDPSDIVGRPFSDFIHPDDLPSVLEMYEKLLTGSALLSEYRIVLKSGKSLWVQSSSRAIYEGERFTGLQGILRDITGRKKAENALRESEERYRSILENMLDVYYRSDRDENLIMVSPSGALLLGYDSVNDMLGRNIAEHFYADLEERHKILKEIQKRGYVKNFQVTLRHRDGTPIPVSASSRYYYDANGDILGIEGIFRDIRESKKTEEALRESETRYRLLVENSNDLIYSTDVTGYFTYVNPVAERFVGRSRSEILEKNYLFFVRPDFHEKITAFYQKQYRENIPNTYFEYPIITRNQEEKWIGQNVQPLLDRGNIIGFQAVARDITDRKQAEQALIHSEEQYRNLVETIKEVIYETDENGIVTFVSQSERGLRGYEPSEIVGRHITEFVYYDDLPRLLEMYQKIMSGPIPLSEYRLVLKSGELIWVQASSRAVFEDGKFKGLRGTLTDISERRMAEQALRESEKKYRELVDFLPISLFEIDLEGDIISGNPAIFETFGYIQEDLDKGLNAFKMIVPEDLTRMFANIPRVLAGEKKEGSEYRGIRKDGSTFPFLIFSSAIFRGDTPVGLRGAIIDLTVQKQTEAALHKISLSLAEAQRITHMGNWEWNIKSDEMYWSDEVYRIVGTTPQEFPKTYEAFVELIHPDDRGTVLHALQDVVNERMKREIEHRIIRPDGQIRSIRQRVEPLLDDTGLLERMIGIVQDVTEKNRFEQELQNARDQLLQSEKLAAIGRLSAGVAHEILNPVNIISLELQTLQITENITPETKKELDICMAQIKRIVTIAENLKQFSRIPAKEKTMTRVDINDVIAHVLMLYSMQLKIEGIETELQYPLDLPEILIEKEKIEQVISNLISNAMDAMEGRDHKVLRITTKREAPSGGHDYLTIMVADTGSGIEDELMPRIFDPFFTTKEPGKGTGLGLSISYGIIQDHDGKIWAENNEWGGASFFVELPVKSEANNVVD